MIRKVIVASILASIVGIVVFYLVADLLGSQILLKGYYSEFRHPNLLSRDVGRITKYFLVFLTTNLVWSYVFCIRQSAFQGSAVEKGIKLFLLLWFLTIPIHLWSWILIPYSKKVLVFNIFVYYLTLSLASGAVIGKVCSDNQ